MTAVAATARGASRATRQPNDLDEPVEEAVLVDVFRTLASQSEERRTAVLRLMSNDEGALSDADSRVFAIRRLRALLQLSDEDAATVIASYERVMSELPPGIAVRRASLLRALLAQMSSIDQVKLRDLLPHPVTGMRVGTANTSHVHHALSPKRRRWNFWLGNN